MINTTLNGDDWCIVAADLSQIELRLVAHAAEEREMIRIFRNGSDPVHLMKYHSKISPYYRGDKCFDCDIHLGTAQTLQRGEIDKETRKKAKAVNFGFVYGMWAPKFVAYAKEKFGLNLTAREGANYREAFFEKYEGLLPWHRRVEAFVSRNGYIDSVFGRRRHLPNAKLDNDCEEWMRRCGPYMGPGHGRDFWEDRNIARSNRFPPLTLYIGDDGLIYQRENS